MHQYNNEFTDLVEHSDGNGPSLFFLRAALCHFREGKSSCRSKIFILALTTVLACIAVDMVIGYRGWSVDYVLPAGIVLVDTIIIGCMFFNRRSWQSYMM